MTCTVKYCEPLKLGTVYRAPTLCQTCLCIDTILYSANIAMLRFFFYIEKIIDLTILGIISSL